MTSTCHANLETTLTIVFIYISFYLVVNHWHKGARGTASNVLYARAPSQSCQRIRMLGCLQEDKLYQDSTTSPATCANGTRKRLE